MGLKVGIDFGTSNSGVAIYQDGEVHVLPIDSKNIVPEVVKTILYITRDYKHFIGQEAVENYYKHNINRQRRFVKKWSGEIDYHWRRVCTTCAIYTSTWTSCSREDCCSSSRQHCAQKNTRGRRFSSGITA